MGSKPCITYIDPSSPLNGDSNRSSRRRPSPCRESLPSHMSQKNQSQSATLANEVEDVEPGEIDRKDWQVNRILNKRIENGKQRYLVSWKHTEQLEKDIRDRNSNKPYARCSGSDFFIRNLAYLPPTEHGELRCEVDWKNTWHDLVDVENAQEAIAEYEAGLQPDTRQQTPGLTTTEQPDTDELWNHDCQTQQWQPVNNPPPPNAIIRRFKPRQDVDYGDYIRSMILATEGSPVKLTKMLMSLMPVRSLFLRSEYIALGKQLNLEPRKSQPFLAYTSGFEQRMPCDNCADKTRPLELCVISAVEMSGGACTSCAYRGFSRTCNFHHSPRPGVVVRPSQKEEKCLTLSPTADNSSPAASSSPITPADRSSAGAPTITSTPINQTSPLTETSPLHHRQYPEASPELGTASPFAWIKRIRNQRVSAIDQESSPTMSDFEEILASIPVPNAETLSGPTTDPARQLGPSPLSQKASRSTERSKTPHLGQREEQDPDISDSTIVVACAPTEKPGGGSRAKKRRRRAAVASTSPPLETSLHAVKAWSGPRHRQSKRKRSESTHRPCPTSSTPPVMVYRDMRFEGHEATAAQVRFIIDQCDAEWKEYFDAAWQDWVLSRKKKSKPLKYTKEAYLAGYFYKRMNECVEEFCPPKASFQFSPSAGTQIKPIVVDD